MRTPTKGIIVFKFENLHRTKAHAFIDGLLCGAVLTGIGISIYKAYQEDKRVMQRIKEDDEKNGM